MPADPTIPALRIGVSACLLGQAVRWDGGDRRSDGVAALRTLVEVLPICPEVEAGLGVPRPAVRLIRGLDGRLAARGVRDPDLDVTAALEGFASRAVAKRRWDGLCLKSRSPSCGAGTTPIHDDHGRVLAQGSGLFAAALMARFPALPIVDETDLSDLEACRVFLFAARLARDPRQVAQAAALIALLRRHAVDEAATLAAALSA